MSGSIGSIDRQVLPRWRSAGETARFGELQSIRPHSVNVEQLLDLETKAQEWGANQSPIIGAEFVAAALLSLSPERAVDAATAILVSEPSDSLMASLARRYLDLTTDGAAQELEPGLLHETALFAESAAVKRRLRFDPRDAVAWCDLALQYSKLGQLLHAADAMQKALWLAPSNRFVLRSAARLYVHAGDPERAHHLLIPFARAGSDPWLMAAELAVASASRRSPRAIKNGRLLLNSGHLSPFNSTELASALGTLELAGGEVKRAKRLFGQALEDPTENSLAQVEWAATRLDGLLIHEKTLNQPDAHEARARMFQDQKRWSEAVDESWQWLIDQPFSYLPAAFGSCIAEMALRDFERAAAFARFGLTANKNNPTLLNNLAVAQIEMGQISEAAQTLRSISPPSAQDSIGVTWQATVGLLAFRRGDRDAGRLDYQVAIDSARRLGLTERLTMASIMLAREEWRLDGPAAAPFVMKAFENGKRSPDALIDLCLSLLSTELEMGRIAWRG